MVAVGGGEIGEGGRMGKGNGDKGMEREGLEKGVVDGRADEGK